MSAKRLNKRQAREQQELEQLAAEKGAAHEASSNPDASSDDEDSSQSGPAPASSSSIFAALNAGDADNVEDEEGSDDEVEDGDEPSLTANSTATKKKNKKKNKKKKKKSAAGAEEQENTEHNQRESVSDSVKTSTSTPVKKAPKKKPQPDNLDKDLSKMSMDDFDSLLASQPHLASNAQSAGSSSSKPLAMRTSPANALRSCLSLQQNHLDPSVELKRQFGSAAIKAFEAANGGTSGGASSSASSGARARMMARNPNLKLRSVLVQPRPDWPPIARTFTGMSGDLHTSSGDDNAADEESSRIATWEHTRAYRAAQYEFQQAVASYDPNNVYALFQSYPWHVHLLSSLSDIAKHQGDLGAASDWNARVLFAYERTASPVFTSSLTSPSGPIAVDFRKVENRGLFLAAHRMIAFLGRRGTWRTALEWAKFLLGLDIHDPHACLLWVDFLAIKSKQHKWLVEDFLPAARKMRELKWAGGIAFAEALGIRSIERENGDKTGTQSTPALQAAIRQHPYILPALYSKLSLSLPSGMADHAAVSPTLTSADESSSLREIISSIYAARNESLWKDSDVKEWLTSTVSSVWQAASASAEGRDSSSALTPTPLSMSQNDKFSLYRHVLVSDMPDALRQSLTSLIPRTITSDATNLDAFDPLPPRGQGATRIDDEYFAVLYRTGSAQQQLQQQGQRGQTEEERGIMERLVEFLRRGGVGFGRGAGGAEAGEGAGDEADEEARRAMDEQFARILQDAHREGEAGLAEEQEEEGEEGEWEHEEEEDEDVPGGWGR